MPDFDNTNRGALFRNENKETANHPDYTGKINVNGKDLWISAWLKEAKSGKKFMSLAVTEPRKDGKKDDVVTDVGDDPINLDDIPF